MFISQINKRIQMVRNQYSTKEKRTRSVVACSFKLDPRGFEYTDLPEIVSSKKYGGPVKIETILTEDEIHEVKTWLDAEKVKNRADNLQRDWMHLPLVLKRLTDGADELILEEDDFTRFSAFSDMLSEAVSHRIAVNEKKMLAEDRKEAFEKVKVLNAIQ